HDCAFFANYVRRKDAPETVLLRVEPDSLGRGVLFWQGSHDTYELSHFTASAGSAPDSRKPDVKHQWVNVWGERHMHNIAGPSPSRRPATSLLSAKLKAGQVQPEDLELTPDRTGRTVGADFSRLQIPKRNATRPR